MAEYTRGLENREKEHSGHNAGEKNNTRRRTWGVDFDAVNYEQRRPPYGSSEKGIREGYDGARNHPGGSGHQREDA